MSRARRITAWVSIAVGVLVGLVVLFAAFVLFTTNGAKMVLSIAGGRELPARAEAIEGALGNRFMLRGVEFKSGPVEGTIDTVIVSWQPLGLLTHRIDVREVTLAGARVHVTANTAAADTSVAAAQDSAPDDFLQKWVISAKLLRVRNASVDAPGDVHLDHVDFVASGKPDEYRGEIRASGSAGPLERAAVFVRASGNTRAMTADSLDVRALGGVLHGTASVGWETGLSWDGRVQGDSLHVGELADSPADWAGALSFRASSTGILLDDSTRIAVDVHSLAGNLRERPLSARGHVELDGNRIEASDTWIRWGSAEASLSGSMAQTADVRLNATIPDLGEILPRASGSASVRGTLLGTPAQIDVDVDVEARDVRTGEVDIPDLDATLDATLSAREYVPHAVDIRRAQIHMGESRLDTRGRVSWSDGIEWDGAVAAENFEASTFTPERWNLHGPVSIDATTQGIKRGRDLRGHLALESLSGTLRGHELNGAGTVTVNRREMDVSALHLEWGNTHVIADGHVGDRLDFNVDIAAPNLAEIDSSLSGAVSLRGTASGSRRTPRVTADVTADSVRVGEYAVHRLEGHVDADLTFATPADVRLLALGAARGETAVDSLQVTASGPREDHHVTVAVTREDMRAAFSLHGAYADSAWTGWLEDVSLRHAKMVNEWRSRGRASLLVSRSHVRADSLVLTAGDASFSAHGSWQHNDTTHVDVDMRGLELAVFERYLGEGVRVTGTADGSVVATMDPQGAVAARIDLVPGPGEITLGDRKVAYRGRITGRADSDGVSAQVDLGMERAGAQLATVAARLSIPGFVPGRDSLGTQPIEGGVDVECSDIAPVMAILEPSWSGTSGSLTAHLSPVGTAGDFRLKGRAALENGRIDLPSGLHLRDVEIAVVSNGDGQISMDGAVTSGGGRAFLKASSARSEKGWVNGSFTVKGKRVQIINQPEAQVFVSPDLELHLSEQVMQISGRVRVPYARIETAEVPASAVSASNDVVVVEDTLATKPRLQVRTQINVELGDSVTFNGFGLRARLAGNLTINDERGRPTRGQGEIQIIDGKYRAYGNELKIDPGRLIFGGGPIDNPGIDIRAYRGLTTQNVMSGSGEMVGMNLRGTLRRPEFSVFSNPPMSQSEIMSYLVMGRPMNESGDQSALASAALLVGMQQGTGVAGNIGKKFSLDEAYIDAGSEIKETSFVAGKYLSPKLYISYAAGLFENTNTFRARYSLTRKWTLQAESGKDSSTDLLYWFERGK